MTDSRHQLTVLQTWGLMPDRFWAFLTRPLASDSASCIDDLLVHGEAGGEAESREGIRLR